MSGNDERDKPSDEDVQIVMKAMIKELMDSLYKRLRGEIIEFQWQSVDRKNIRL